VLTAIGTQPKINYIKKCRKNKTKILDNKNNMKKIDNNLVSIPSIKRTLLIIQSSIKRTLLII